jgi:hypothetical protein
METLLVLLIVIAAAAYAARSLLPQAWLPRRLRQARPPGHGCSTCGSDVKPHPPAATRQPKS